MRPGPLPQRRLARGKVETMEPSRSGCACLGGMCNAWQLRTQELRTQECSQGSSWVSGLLVGVRWRTPTQHPLWDSTEACLLSVGCWPSSAVGGVACILAAGGGGRGGLACAVAQRRPRHPGHGACPLVVHRLWNVCLWRMLSLTHLTPCLVGRYRGLLCC